MNTSLGFISCGLRLNIGMSRFRSAPIVYNAEIQFAR